MKAGWRDGAMAGCTAAPVIPSERVARVEGSWRCPTSGEPSRPRAIPPSRPRAISPSRPEGVTLVELLVVLVLFAIIAGTTGVALRRNPPPADDVAHSRAQLRRQAIRSGEPVTTRDSLGYPIRFLPDGRAVGAGMDALTGRTRAPR